MNSSIENLEQTDVLCIYGLNPEQVAADLKNWLGEGEKALLFIKEYGQIPHFELLNHPQIQFIEPTDDAFCQAAWEYVFLRFGYLAPDGDTRAEQLFEKFKHYQAGAHLVASDYQDFGLRIFTNACANSALLSQARSSQALKGRFQGVPAIICGAGPSLAKNIDNLARLGEGALIFAGGSSLNALSVYGIEPHFSASFDPDPPYRRFFEQVFFETPFFYQQRVSRDLLRLAHGPLVWAPDNGNYPIEAYIAEAFGLEAVPLDSGWGVPNFCMALAVEMGCNPIVLVGMDLACTDQKLYAPGIVAKADDQGLVQTVDREGKQVFSRRDWIMSAEWIADFARQHPHITFINATEGGLGFDGVAEQPLATLNFGSGLDLKGQIHAALSQIAKIGGMGEKALEDIDKSLLRIETLCDQLLAELERIFPQIPQEKGECVLLEFDLEDELVYKKILEPLWNIWKFALQRHAKDAYQIYLHRLLFFKRVIKGYRHAREI